MRIDSVDMFYLAMPEVLDIGDGSQDISGQTRQVLDAIDALLARAGSDEREPLKQRGAQFDATGLSVRQFFATSADGESIPYFVIGPGGHDEAAAKSPAAETKALRSDDTTAVHKDKSTAS